MLWATACLCLGLSLAAPAPATAQAAESPTFPSWLRAANIAASLLQMDPAVTVQLSQGTGQDLHFRVKVAGCGPKPKPGCDETARKTKAGAIKALLAQGALASSPMYANGTALKTKVLFNKTSVPPLALSAAMGVCEIYDAALIGNWLYYRSVQDETTGECYLEFEPLAVQYRVDALDDPDSFKTIMAQEAAAIAFGIGAPVYAFSGHCAGLTPAFDLDSIPTATCPLAGNLLGDVSDPGIVPAWTAALNVLVAWVRHDPGMDARLTAVEATGRLTVEVVIHTCEEAREFKEGYTCKEEDQAKKATAWATFITRGALLGMTVANNSTMSLKVFYKGAGVPPLVPATTPLGATPAICNLYHLAFKSSELYSRKVLDGERDWETQDVCFLVFHPVALQYRLNSGSSPGSIGTLTTHQAMTLLLGITSPYVAGAEMCEKPAFYDQNGMIKGPSSPLKNCAMPTSLVNVDA